MKNADIEISHSDKLLYPDDKISKEDVVEYFYLRNDYAMTAVAPYSLRAKKGAPVATPLEWEELHDKSLHAQSYHLKNVFGV